MQSSNRLHATKHIIYLCSDLSGGISLSQCSAVWFFVHSIKVNRDAKRNCNLIGSCVAPADRPAGIVHFVRNIQFCQGLSCELTENEAFTLTLENLSLELPSY